MQKASRPPDKWRYVVFAGVALLVVLADQLTKAWLRSTLDTGQVLFDAGAFRIIHIYNTGAAFGLLRGHSQVIAIAAMAGIVVILVILSLLHRRWAFMDMTAVRVAVGLVVGGTIGNLADRLRLGHVTDFIDFKVWPAFNIADAAVTIGVIIIVYHVLFLSQSTRRQE